MCMPGRRYVARTPWATLWVELMREHISVGRYVAGRTWPCSTQFLRANACRVGPFFRWRTREVRQAAVETIGLWRRTVAFVKPPAQFRSDVTSNTEHGPLTRAFVFPGDSSRCGRGPSELQRRFLAQAGLVPASSYSTRPALRQTPIKMAMRRWGFTVRKRGLSDSRHTRKWALSDGLCNWYHSTG